MSYFWEGIYGDALLSSVVSYKVSIYFGIDKISMEGGGEKGWNIKVGEFDVFGGSLDAVAGIVDEMGSNPDAFGDASYTEYI